jgi:hypothetical protein
MSLRGGLPNIIFGKGRRGNPSHFKTSEIATLAFLMKNRSQLARNDSLRSLSERGQFIPITAMIMFTAVVIMVAVVNVYQVSRAKLKVQNLADAAALNIASQEAQEFNTITDRNEWLNHMVAGVPSPSDSTSGTNPCAAMPWLVPGISCVENTAPKGRPSALATARHIFHSKDGVTNYAALVKTVNDAQKLFQQAYENFMGVTGSVGGAGSGSLSDLLKTDIPELQTDPTIHMAVWNSVNGENAVNSNQKQTWNNPKNLQPNSNGAEIDSKNMKSIPFTVHDPEVRYYKQRCLAGICVHNTDIDGGTLGSFLPGSGPVGYMVPDANNAPQIAVQSTGKQRYGVGVYIVKQLILPILGPYVVAAQSKAFIVNNSGETGTLNGNVPVFKPTYWVKLAND